MDDVALSLRPVNTRQDAHSLLHQPLQRLHGSHQLERSRRLLPGADAGLCRVLQDSRGRKVVTPYQGPSRSDRIFLARTSVATIATQWPTPGKTVVSLAISSLTIWSEM